jgi:nucleotide-binding universal stress UspA family protein
MFKRILVPVDLTQRHQKAIDFASELARQAGGEIVLLHVIEVIAGMSVDEDKAFYARLEKKAQGNLERLSASLQQSKVPFRAEVVYGNRGPEIIRYAGESAIDLIVLTRPRLEPSNLATGLGSLSHKLSIFAECPVLLVRA